MGGGQNKKNSTGLPDKLKAGIESLSGYSMDDVKVHCNSSEPGQLKELSNKEGAAIHLAPGQESHLPHEDWHIVQQKKGKVQSRKQPNDNASIINDTELETEADVLGKKAIIKKKHT